MSVPLLHNPLNGSLFQTSEVYFANPGAFDDFSILNDLRQQHLTSSFPCPMTQDDGSNMDESAFDDAEASPTDLLAASTSTDSEMSTELNTKLRRRAQNRASQRAFRERKERHLRSLKATLATLGSKHRNLLESYSQQSEAVMQLKGRIAELHAQIAALSMQAERELNSVHTSCQPRQAAEFQQFDAFSFSSRPPDSPNKMFWCDPSRQFSEASPLRLPASQDLPGFEDLLSVP